MTDQPTKRCNRCHHDKQLNAFTRHVGRPDGLQPACTPCKREIAKAHYEKVKARNLALRAAEQA